MYTPPAGNAANLVLYSYTPPAGNNADFDFGGTVIVEVSVMVGINY